jgi:hypothetical protein
LWISGLLGAALAMIMLIRVDLGFDAFPRGR